MFHASSLCKHGLVVGTSAQCELALHVSALVGITRYKTPTAVLFVPHRMVQPDRSAAAATHVRWHRLRSNCSNVVQHRAAYCGTTGQLTGTVHNPACHVAKGYSTS